MRSTTDNVDVDSGDENPGPQLFFEGEVDPPKLTDKKIAEFTKDWFKMDEDCEVIKEKLCLVISNLKQATTDIVIDAETSRLCDNDDKPEASIIALAEEIFLYTNDNLLRCYFRPIDQMLCATIILADKGAWFKPATTRKLRNHYYKEFKLATLNYVKSIAYLRPDYLPPGDYLNWIYHNRLTQLIGVLLEVAEKEVGKEEKSLASILLAHIYGWLELGCIKMDSKRKGYVVEQILSIVSYNLDKSVHIHYGDDLSEEPHFESFCRCNVSDFDEKLCSTLRTIYARGDEKIKKVVLDHALSGPDKLISSSALAWEAVVSSMSHSDWKGLSKIIDEHILPRLEGNNKDAKAKAAWMINICIDDQIHNLEYSSKYLEKLLDFMGDKCERLRSQCHLAWFKVLVMLSETPTIESLKKKCLEKLLEIMDTNSTDLTKGYEVECWYKRTYNSKKYCTMSDSIWLYPLAVLQDQLVKDSGESETAKDMKKYLSKLKLIKPKKKFKDQFRSFRKLYSELDDKLEQIDLIESVCR